MPLTIRSFLTCFAIVSSLTLSACGDGKDDASIQADPQSIEMAETMEDQHHPAIEARSAEAITEDVHSQLLTIDTHVDIPDDFATEAVDPGGNDKFQVDLTKMEEGNLSAVFFIVYVGQTERTEANYAEAVSKARNKFDAIHRMTDELYSNRIGLATSADDILRIRGEGKLVALIGVENGFAFGSDLSTVEEYFSRGMRYAGFAHMGHSNFADSSLAREDLGDAPEEHGGLSELGKGLLKELNRLGVMADVSHASKAATLDIARLSTAPVIASHSGARAVYDHFRNLTDEEMLAIKKTGGVVQIVGFDTYLAAPPEEKVAAKKALAEKYNYSRATRASLSPETIAAYRGDVKALDQHWPRANVSILADHIDYAVKLIGIDHVGISSDFDGGGGLTGWMDASQTANVTQELILRGYSVGDIKKIWGGNLLRVMRDVEAKAG